MDEYYSPNRTTITTTNVNYNNNVITNKINVVTSNEIHAPVKVVRKRTTANKKERRRTQSINSAYSSLREHIPNVPSDTKLSKVSFVWNLNTDLGSFTCYIKSRLAILPYALFL